MRSRPTSSLTVLRLLASLAAAAVLGTVAAVLPAQAQTATPDTAGAGPMAQAAGEGPTTAPVTPDPAGPLAAPRGARPVLQPPDQPPSSAGGLGMMQRMGIPLPELPPEKPYAGKVDDAYGAFQRGLFATAFDKALPRAKAGDAAAQTLIAELMVRGLAIKRDEKGAAFWYGEAAKAGDPAAMFKYALLLMEGRDVPANRKLADDYMHRAAEAGNPSAQFNWGQILVSQNPGPKGLNLALPYYEKAAEQGIADAQYAVAQIYRNLVDLPEEKRQTARQWLLRAARAGFDTAQLDMGIWLVNGIGGAPNLEEGFQWMRIIANRGNVLAQNRLAHLYVGALGTRPDPVEAAKWYVLSRRAGLNDPILEDFYLGLPDAQQKQALDAANKYRAGRRAAPGTSAVAAADAEGDLAASPGGRPDPARFGAPAPPANGLPGVVVPPPGGASMAPVEPGAGGEAGSETPAGGQP